MSLPENFRYTADHEWISVDGEIATIGITDHAQEELTDIVFVELPELGRECSASEAIAVVESVKAASDIYCPIDGEVTEVNEALESNPELINTAPHTDGWIYKLKLSNSAQLESLMSAADYSSHIGK